jgi:hypothetical protein
MAAAVEPGWTTAAYVALLFGVVEPLTAYAIEPFVYGHSTGLAPVSVVVAAVFWTWIWGPIGLILSTPLTLCLVVMGRHVKSLEFFDVLLGDRPALSPVQNFYQRILAGNPGEALDKAEAIIVDRSLESYYDEVVVGAMRLAAEDEARGMLGRDRMTAITRSVMGVIRDLDDRAADTAPARVNPPSLAPRSTTMVACVAGRGPFDEAVASMLHQLLTQRGTSARRIPASALVRDTDPQIDISDVSVVVLCSLALSDTTPRLERLVRRLRQRIPGVGVVLGLWSGDAVLQDSALQGQIGADRFVTSLGMAVTATSELLGSTPAATPQEDRQTGIAAPVRLATR